MLRKLIKYLYFSFKKITLKKQNIIIESNVSFSKTTFSKYNRICANTYIDYSSIGNFSYVGWNSILKNVEIGSFCSIAPFVEVIYGSHPTNFISTHPIFYSNRKQCGISFLEESTIDEFNLVGNKKRSVIIGNDVWIGYGVKIIEGVTIKDGAIILAGAIVTKDVEAYSIVGGVPAKHIKYRFDEKTKNFLIQFKWWGKDIKWIKENISNFTNPNNFFELYNKGN